MQLSNSRLRARQPLCGRTFRTRVRALRVAGLQAQGTRTEQQAQSQPTKPTSGVFAALSGAGQLLRLWPSGKEAPVAAVATQVRVLAREWMLLTPAARQRSHAAAWRHAGTASAARNS